jgi:hypothetical protein
LLNVLYLITTKRSIFSLSGLQYDNRIGNSTILSRLKVLLIIKLYKRINMYCKLWKIKKVAYMADSSILLKGRGKQWKSHTWLFSSWDSNQVPLESELYSLLDSGETDIWGSLWNAKVDRQYYTLCPRYTSGCIPTWKNNKHLTYYMTQWKGCLSYTVNTITT